MTTEPSKEDLLKLERYTLPQIAELFGVKPNKVYEWEADGILGRFGDAINPGKGRNRITYNREAVMACGKALGLIDATTGQPTGVEVRRKWNPIEPTLDAETGMLRYYPHHVAKFFERKVKTVHQWSSNGYISAPHKDELSRPFWYLDELVVFSEAKELPDPRYF